MGVKPIGEYEGNAKICAEVLRKGGNILNMHDAGIDALYAVCLSNGNLEIEVQKEIVSEHIPF